MVERLGEMRKERIEKGSREGIEKETKAYRKHLKKNMSWCETECKKKMPLVKQNVMKLEVIIIGKQRIDQKRKKGWGRGRRERIEKGSRERIEIERKETKGN